MIQIKKVNVSFFSSAMLWVLSLLLIISFSSTINAQTLTLAVSISTTGNVSWSTVEGTTKYELGYSIGCRGPRVIWEATDITSFQMPNYDSSLHLNFWVKAFGDVNGREGVIAEGNGSNNGECYIPTEPDEPIETDDSTNIPSISVRYVEDVTRGFIAWEFPVSISLFEVSYSRCGGPWITKLVTTLGASGAGVARTQFQIPNYDISVRYDFRVRGLDDQYNVLSEGFSNNGRECSATPPPLPQEIEQLGLVIAPLSVQLDSGTGQVSWGPLNDTTRFVVYYTLCLGSREAAEVGSVLSFQIPNFRSELRYDVRVDAFEGFGSLVGFGVISNNIACETTSNPDPIYQDTSNQPGTINLRADRLMTISHHAGSSLVVNINNGHIQAEDRTLGTSLSALGRCVAGQTIASNDSLVISCTSDGNFKVLQVHPQHPADRRRDFVVFNPWVNYCYRAYEYIETGAVEIFYTKC